MHAYMLDGIRAIVAFCEDSDLLLYELQGTILEGLLTAKKLGLTSVLWKC